MSNIYETLVSAIRAHWTAHGQQYPQKILLTPQQHRELLDQRRTGRIALGSGGEPEVDRFLGALLEIDASTPGAIVAVDGTVSPLLPAA